MCMICCKWCGNWLIQLPCLFCQMPEEFKKKHPKLYNKYVKQREEAISKHRCKTKDLKEKVEYFRNLWHEEIDLKIKKGD